MLVVGKVQDYCPCFIWSLSNSMLFILCVLWLLGIKITRSEIYSLILTIKPTKEGETRLYEVVAWPLLLHGGMCALTTNSKLKEIKIKSNNGGKCLD